jgi:hypothetical protein
MAVLQMFVKFTSTLFRVPHLVPIVPVVLTHLSALSQSQVPPVGELQ